MPEKQFIFFLFGRWLSFFRSNGGKFWLNGSSALDMLKGFFCFVCFDTQQFFSPIGSFSVFLGRTSGEQNLKCLAQGHKCLAQGHNTLVSLSNLQPFELKSKALSLKPSHSFHGGITQLA